MPLPPDLVRRLRGSPTTNELVATFSQNAPLVDRYIRQIDRTVTEIATRQFIGARILPVFTLISEGVTTLDWFDLTAMQGAIIDADGLTENDDNVGFTPKTLRVPVIHKDWRLGWRDLKAAQAPGDGGLGKGLDTGNVQEATRQVLLGVDDLLLNGNADLSIDGLSNAAGANTGAGTSWNTPGNAYADSTAFVAMLEGANHFGPYVGVVHPTEFGKTRKVFPNTGIPQRGQIVEVLDGGLFRTPAITPGTGVFFSQGQMNADLVTATGGPKTINLAQLKYVEFMLYDISVARIRRAASIFQASRLT